MGLIFKGFLIDFTIVYQQKGWNYRLIKNLQKIRAISVLNEYRL